MTYMVFIALRPCLTQAIAFKKMSAARLEAFPLSAYLPKSAENLTRF
jgi:hypothetical protein